MTCRKLTVERVYTPGFTLTADQYEGIKPYTTTLHISYPAAPNQAVSVVSVSVTGDSCVKDATLDASGKADVSYEVRRTHMIYVMLKKTDCCTTFDYMNCPTSNYVMLKVGALGSISFASVPEGAEIFLDGADQSIKTPATITDVPAGSHTYTLKLSGYNDYTGTVEVLKDQTVSVSVELVPAEGCIFFVTEPAGAKVVVDGTDTGKITPVLICGLSTGPHTYSLSLAGYLDSTGSVELAAGQGTKVTVTLERKFGSISFASTPSGARVFLDGQDQEMVTPATLTNVPIGSHAFILKLAGYNDYSGTVEVLENQISSVSATLVPAEGCIYFSTTPAGARIFIDNVDTGKVTPSLVCGLTLGAHTYRLSLTGYQDITGNVNLAAGQGTTVTGTLPKKGIGTGTLLGIGLLGAGVLGAVVYATREKKYSPPKEYMKYPSTPG